MWEMDSFLTSAPAEAAGYDYLERDNATFCRRRGRTLVDDVFDRRTNTWHPYTGDRFAAAYWGDLVDDPAPNS
jgi:hypothetical protein